MAGIIRIILTTALMTGIARIGLCQDCQVGAATGNDTQQIQNALNSCSVVTMKSGEHYWTGTLKIKSNTTWNLNGATIQTFDNESKFHPIGSYGDHVWIGANDGASNITIKGIPGDRMASVLKRKTKFGLIPTIHGRTVNNWVLKDFFIDTREIPSGKGHGGFHIELRRKSQNITVQNVTILSNKAPGTTGTDGIHLDAKNVVINNCLVDVEDDGIPLSSADNWPVSNILVTNTRIGSRIRFGRDMPEEMNDVTVREVTIDHSTHPRMSNGFPALGFIIGGACCGYIPKTYSANLRNFTFENITMINVGKIIKHEGNMGYWTGRSYDLTLQNITAQGPVKSNSTIYGVTRLKLHNISSQQPTTINLSDVCGVSIRNLSNVNIVFGSDVTDVVYDGSNPVCTGNGTPPGKISPPTRVRVDEKAQ